MVGLHPLAMSDDTSGHPVDFYLCFQAFDNTGTVIKQNLTGYLLPTGGSGLCFSFTYPFINGWSTVLVPFLRSIMSTFTSRSSIGRASAVVQRYMLQVTGQ